MKLSQAITLFKTKGMTKPNAELRVKQILNSRDILYSIKHKKLFEAVWKATIAPAKNELSGKRHWVITDIHGCYKTFLSLLKKIDFGPDCILYLLGDYIDHGPDSKPLIDWMMAHKSNVLPLLGNHEQMFISTVTDKELEKFWVKNNGGATTLKSFGIKHSSQLDPKYVKFLKGMKTYLRLDNHILVHGGIDFRQAKPFRNTPTAVDKMLYDRDAQGPSDMKMLIGHSPREIKQIIQSLNTSKVYLDGGCSKGQFLVAYDIDDNKIEYVKAIG
jgi:serine/threonine protein phosphatase 1